MNTLVGLITQLWKPTPDAKPGSVNSKEFILALLFAGVFFLLGGHLTDFVKGVLQNFRQDGDLAIQIETAIVVFVTAFLHREEQVAPKP